MKHLSIITTLSLLASLSSCITEDFQECPNEYDLQIIFDRNMLYADAFASQVKSIDVKVFDSQTGEEVYAASESGEALAAPGYRMPLPIPPGSYDILCWAGMAEGNSFSYATPTANTLEHQDVILNTVDGKSDTRLNNLYHGLSTHVTFIDNNTIGSREKQTAVVSLTKDTNRILVMLHNLDGTEMATEDFEVTISATNGEMAYNNSIAAARKVLYEPWHIIPIIADTDLESRASVQSALAAEMSVGRLVSNTDTRLEVKRLTDGETIISIPLVRNLLLYKGEFYSSMSDQEYLDRQDDYTITFILDNNNWDKAAMIYINNWATLPIQYQEW